MDKEEAALMPTHLRGQPRHSLALLGSMRCTGMCDSILEHKPVKTIYLGAGVCAVLPHSIDELKAWLHGKLG